jgi:hypothetical protein
MVKCSSANVAGLGRRAGGLLQSLVLLAFLGPACSQPVEITSVNPSAGSLAGGTRMHIRGSGFSNNMGGLHPSVCPLRLCL